MDVLGTILTNVNLRYFAGIHKKIKEIGKVEKSLIPNVVVFCNLLIVNPATSCTPERFFFNCKTFKNLAEIRKDQLTF